MIEPAILAEIKLRARNSKITPPKFTIALKNDSWKTSLSFWVPVKFQGRTAKLPGSNYGLDGTTSVLCWLEGS